MPIKHHNLRVEGEPKREPDIEKLARALIAIAEKMARQESQKESRVSPQSPQRESCLQGRDAV